MRFLILLSLLILIPSQAPADGDALKPADPRGEEKRAMIIESAKEYIGTVYSFGGTTSRGFDCSGFVVFIYGQHGIVLPRSSSVQFRIGTKIDESEVRTGDLVFFRIDGDRISHVGIYTGKNEFIHSPSTGKKVRVDSLYDTYWRKRLAGFARYIP